MGGNTNSGGFMPFAAASSVRLGGAGGASAVMVPSGDCGKLGKFGSEAVAAGVVEDEASDVLVSEFPRISRRLFLCFVLSASELRCNCRCSLWRRRICRRWCRYFRTATGGNNASIVLAEARSVTELLLLAAGGGESAGSSTAGAAGALEASVICGKRRSI